MNIVKKCDARFMRVVHQQYQNYLEDLRVNPEQVRVGEHVSVMVPLLTGNGKRSTFYGFMWCNGVVRYVDSVHLLYSVDSIFYSTEDQFVDKFRTLREYGKTYWYDFRSKKEKITLLEDAK